MFASLRYGLRMMAKSPGFTAIAVLTLTLGIGANTAIFTVVNALVLRPLPLANPAQLLTVNAANPARGINAGAFSLQSYETLRDRTHAFAGVAAYCFDSLTLTGSGEPVQMRAARVSPNYFDVLGARPLMGRGFRASEGEPGGQPVVVISYNLWQTRFGGDRAILEKKLPLDGEVYAIVGVLPPEFAFPDPLRDVWVTRLMKFGGFQPEQIANGAGYLVGVARLADGATRTRAESEVAAAYQQYRQEHPRAPDADPNGRLTLVPTQDSLSGGIRPTLLILSGAVGLVLLIACANVAGLTMARSSARAKEIAVRAALGASRRQLIAQLLCESLLLSAAGAVLGTTLASWGVEALVKADAGLTLPGYQPIRVDAAVLGFTVLITLITGVAFGLIPAMQVSRPNLNEILRDGGRGTVGGLHGQWLRTLLVGGQMALSIVLLIGAGLLIESFRQVQHVKLGFDPGHTITARIALPPSKYPDGDRRAPFAKELVERIASLPGVVSASVSQTVPFGGYVFSPMLADGQPVVPPGQRPLGQWNGVTPGYFRTTGTPLLRGRDFTWADSATAARVIIVSQSLARRFWPNEDPVGKHITFTRLQVPFEIVGVVADVKTAALEADPFLLLYSPYAQWTFQSVVVSARTQGDAKQLANAIGMQVAAVDKDLPVTNVQTMDELVANTLSQRRQTLWLIGGFAGVALVLAVIGLYGVMAFSVAQRTAEIGIRQAIGAQPRDILRMVLVQGLRLSAVGIAIGTVAAIGLTRLIAGLLYGVSATDPAVFAGVALVFLAVACAASFAPAWRATRVDPLEALRHR